MKKVLLTLMVVLSVFMVAGCGKKVKNPASRIDEEKIKTNLNENVIKEFEIEGLKISRSSLVYENGRSILTTAITNISNTVVIIDSIDAIYTDEDGVETILPIVVGDPMVQGQTIYVKSETDVDLTKAVSIEYRVRK